MEPARPGIAWVQQQHQDFGASVMGKFGKIMAGLATLTVVVGGCAALAKPTTTGSVTSTSPTPTVVAAPASVNPPVAAPVPAPVSTETVTQRSAVRKAESYLSFAGFSKKGLVKQLNFEKFSKADAEYAVEHVTVDWNEQAAKKAKAYMDLSGFSKDGLIKQLKFEGFTDAEARHGATSVGL